MDPFLIEVPFAYRAATIRPRGRKWEHRWITETTTVSIDRVDAATIVPVATIVDRENKSEEHVLHDGRGFVRDVTSPLPAGIALTEETFASIVAGRTPLYNGRFPDYPFPVIRPERMHEPKPEEIVFTNAKGLEGAGVAAIGEGDVSRSIALANCARMASTLFSADGRLMRRTNQPLLRLDMTLHAYDNDRGHVSRDRSQERGNFLVPLSALADGMFDRMFFDRGLLQHDVRILDASVFRGFDVFKGNALAMASTLQSASGITGSIEHVDDADALETMAEVLMVAAALRRTAVDSAADRVEVLRRVAELASAKIVPGWLAGAAGWMLAQKGVANLLDMANAAVDDLALSQPI